MIPKECKRLAEVDFPIAVVSKHAAKEKSIRHGHPSTLHIWWARRPLAACRAILLALLLPDPCDENCPEEFKQRAREYLVSPIASGTVGPSDLELRHALLKFIGDFANWDLASNRTYLEASRKLVKAAHGEETLLVVDPFAGGGSIPLEALRLGCDAFASDLNPVAHLILKTMIEDIPRQGPGLADELRRVGADIKKAAEKELAEFYPADPDGSRPMAYLWARTIHCEQPDCGAEIPLIRTMWLAKRYNKGRRIYSKLISLDIQGDLATKRVETRIKSHDVPTSNLPEISSQTIKGGKAICPCCNRIVGDARVRAQLSTQGGGCDVILDSENHRVAGARLIAVILRKPDSAGLFYRSPNDQDLIAIGRARQRLSEDTESLRFPPLPSEPISPKRPSPNARGVSGATRIGVTDFGRLFTSRQKLALATLSELVKSKSPDQILQRLLCLSISKLAERSSSFVTWINSTEAPRGTFSRQALTIAWDFIELVPVLDHEEFLELIDAMAVVILKTTEANLQAGQVAQTKASQSPIPSQAASIWFTDPPYYDAVPYADVSDFFYVWHKRIIPESILNVFHAESADGLTPKSPETTWNEAHVVNGELKTPAFFERSVAEAFLEGKRVLSTDGLASVVFAHKSTEGWEALLTGMLKSGWVIVASWPITTERGARLNAKESAALAASVHLVCRPRTEDKVGDWQRVLRELPKRVGDWMERLQSEGIRGADLVFACIGPALEIYSQYAKVVDAEEREIPLGGDPEAKEAHKRGYLAYVWEVVGRSALEQVLGTAEAKARNGAAGALEEDARLTALFLWTLQSSNGKEIEAEKDNDDVEESGVEEDERDEGGKAKKKGFTLIYDVARRFAQPLGIHLEDWEGRTIEIKKGIVRLLPISERAKQLFGEEGMQTVAAELERGSRETLQISLFPDVKDRDTPKVRGRRRARASSETSDRKMQTRWEPTTLDRVHAAMLLQSSGRANALRALLENEQERGPDFLRLANALSALYPKESEEKRLLDAMLLAVPR